MSHIPTHTPGNGNGPSNTTPMPPTTNQTPGGNTVGTTMPENPMTTPGAPQLNATKSTTENPNLPAKIQTGKGKDSPNLDPAIHAANTKS